MRKSLTVDGGSAKKGMRLEVNIFSAVALIGVTTLLLSLLAVVIGNRVGARFQRPAVIERGDAFTG